MSTEYHVTQFDGSGTCAPRNCAAASGAMAVAFAGGDPLTAKQFRAESGVSCTPGVDSVSGGLRIVDVQRVAQAHGVAVNYGGLQSWPVTALHARLAMGQGAIVLGDAQDAPVSPTAGVVYHSAFVHGYRDATDETHWHDPRLPAAHWVPMTQVIRYWEGMDHGYRYAGFVAPGQIVTPPDTGTGGPTVSYTVSARPFAWYVRKGTTLNGYDPARPGGAVTSATFESDQQGLAVAIVDVTWAPGTDPGAPSGGPFLQVAEGTFDGLLILRDEVSLEPFGAPTQPVEPAPNCDPVFNEALRLAETTIARIPRR